MSRPKAQVIVAACAAGVIAWLALVIWGPVLPPPLAAVVYGFGSLICHQQPERSFHWAGAQLPVCARCTGIYLGGVLALATLARPAWVRRVWDAPAGVRALLTAGASPTIVTVGAEWLGWWAPGNEIRFAAGMPLGVTAGLVVLAALSTLHYRECLPRTDAGPLRP